MLAKVLPKLSGQSAGPGSNPGPDAPDACPVPRTPSRPVAALPASRKRKKSLGHFLLEGDMFWKGPQLEAASLGLELTPGRTKVP